MEKENGRIYKKNKIYNFLTFFYRLIFVNPKYICGEFGFINKTKLDLIDKFKVRIKYIKTKSFKISGNDAMGILCERHGYGKIKNCNNVLDLGGYVGDSATILSKYNNKIYVFEPGEANFKYILKNIEINNLKEKVIPFNYAIVTNDKKKDKLYSHKDADLHDAAGSIYYKGGEKYEEIKCMNVKDVLKLANFDGLKCDIEGEEWHLIRYFMENSFDFDKGVFELHFADIKIDEINLLDNFIKFLKEKQYAVSFHILDPDKKINVDKYIIKLKNNKFYHEPCLMMYFTRVPSLKQPLLTKEIFTKSKQEVRNSPNHKGFSIFAIFI